MPWTVPVRGRNTVLGIPQAAGAGCMAGALGMRPTRLIPKMGIGSALNLEESAVPIDTQTAELWFKERAAQYQRRGKGGGYVFPAKENFQRVRYPFGMAILAVTLDGKTYTPPYPIHLQQCVTYVLEIVNGRVSFEVDISLASNWNDVPPKPEGRWGSR